MLLNFSICSCRNGLPNNLRPPILVDVFIGLESEERVGGDECRLEYVREARECLRHRLEQWRGICALRKGTFDLQTQHEASGDAEVTLEGGLLACSAAAPTCTLDLRQRCSPLSDQYYITKKKGTLHAPCTTLQLRLSTCSGAVLPPSCSYNGE